jgi:hypothetical protein
MRANQKIDRARLRQRVAQEVIAWCRRTTSGRQVDERERTATALQLHDVHARHARERGDETTAAKAEERYDRELNRHAR